MNKSMLLAATAAIALTGGAALAKQPPMATFKAAIATPVTRHTPGMTVLYNQNSGGDGNYVNSQNYTSGVYSAYNDTSADDFVVPAGQTWKVKELDVTGCCSGTPTSEDVYFFKDRGGMPGRKVASMKGLQGTGNPSFALSLGTGVKLKAGHYWVAVVANCNYEGGCGDWGWAVSSTSNNSAATWRQPGNGAGTGCTDWNTLDGCFGYSGDFLFELQGTSK